MQRLHGLRFKNFESKTVGRQTLETLRRLLESCVAFKPVIDGGLITAFRSCSEENDERMVRGGVKSGQVAFLAIIVPLLIRAACVRSVDSIVIVGPVTSKET